MLTIQSELTQFILCIGVGLAIGGSYAVPVFVSRWRSGQKLIQHSRPNPPWTWPLGIFTFGILTLTSFAIHRPIFGTTFAILLIIYTIGFIRSHRAKPKKQGEQGENGDSEPAA